MKGVLLLLEGIKEVEGPKLGRGSNSKNLYVFSTVLENRLLGD